MPDRTYDDLEEALGREIELKERIRELETELSHRNVAEEIGEVIEFWAARAEQAERERDIKQEQLDSAAQMLEKAEARVAELEKENQRLKWELGREPDPRLDLGESVTLDKLPKNDTEFRAREREEG